MTFQAFDKTALGRHARSTRFPPAWLLFSHILFTGVSQSENMPKTHQILTSPALSTVIHPVHIYDDEQKGKMKALSEVRFPNCMETERFD